MLQPQQAHTHLLGQMLAWLTQEVTTASISFIPVRIIFHFSVTNGRSHLLGFIWTFHSSLVILFRIYFLPTCKCPPSPCAVPAGSSVYANRSGPELSALPIHHLPALNQHCSPLPLRPLPWEGDRIRKRMDFIFNSPPPPPGQYLPQLYVVSAVHVRHMSEWGLPCGAKVSCM